VAFNTITLILINFYFENYYHPLFINLITSTEKEAFFHFQVELMMGTLERIIETEENKHGLIITKALYGRLLSEK
jgi:hypothetical protein